MITYLPRDVAQSVDACAIIGSRLDYCNSLYYGMSKTNLQRVQNAAARIAKLHDANITQPMAWLPDRCVAESTTRLPSSVIKLSNCNNLRILLVCSRHTDTVSRVFGGHQRQTYFSTQSSSINMAARRFSCCAPSVWNSSFICTHSFQFH